MKKVSLLTLVLVFVLGVSLAFAIGLPGKKGGGAKLKKAEKTLALGDLSAGFKKFEGTDLDPFKAAPYKYNVYGDADIDTFLTSSHKIGATMQFANKLVDDLYKKVDAAEKKEDLDAIQADADNLNKVLAAITADGSKLVASGTALLGSAKDKFTSLSALKALPSLLGDLKKCVDCLKKAGDDAKLMTDKIVPLLEKVKTKAAEFAKAA